MHILDILYERNLTVCGLWIFFICYGFKIHNFTLIIIIINELLKTLGAAMKSSLKEPVQ